jgi:hypothetical protein
VTENQDGLKFLTTLRHPTSSFEGRMPPLTLAVVSPPDGSDAVFRWRWPSPSSLWDAGALAAGLLLAKRSI